MPKNHWGDVSHTQQSATADSYLLLVFLVVLNILNMIDRSLIASLSNFIVPELSLTNTQFGLLTGVLFLVLYSVMGMFMGAMADRVNRVYMISSALALWSGLTAVSGFARGFVSLAIPRLFIGVGEAALAPAALSLLTDKFPPNRVGFVSSIFSLGVPVGLGMSLVVAGFLGPILGWRGCFYLLGAVGLMMSLALLLFKEPRRTGHESLSTQSFLPSFSSIVATVKRVLKLSPVLVYVIAAAILVNISNGALSFDQLWLVQERGFDRSEIARLSGMVTVIAGIVGCLVSAYGIDYCCQRFGLKRIWFLFFALLVLAPVNYLYRLSDVGSALFWVSFAAAPLSIGLFIGPLLAVLQEYTPPRDRGTIIGFTLLLINLVGMGLGNVLTGVSIDIMFVRDISQPYTYSLVLVTLLSNFSLLLLFVAGRSVSSSTEKLGK
jgi:MFS family permease